MPSLPTSATLVLAAAALTAGARAQSTYRHEFGTGLVEAADVAVYRACGAGEEHVFVADPAQGLVLRYDGDGSDDPAPAAGAPAYWEGPWGVAVDDSPSSPNFGQVYAIEDDGNGWGLLIAYPDAGLGLPTVISVKWDDGGVWRSLEQPRGVAVDRQGNVYIADPMADRVFKLAAADAAHIGAVSTEREAELVVDTLWSAPQDVSVDVLGRMHVTHPCGCLAVFHPDGTLFGLGAILAAGCLGVDAKDDHASTRTTTGEVVTYAWDLPDETHSLKEVYGGAQLSDPRGLEFEKLPRPFLGGFRCEDRVFVADGSAGRVVVFGEDFLSTPRPNGAVAHWSFETVGATTPDGAGPHDMVLSGFGWPRPERGRVRCGLGFFIGAGLGTVADAPGLDFGAADLTLEAWIRTTDASGTDVFLDKRDGFGGYAAYLEDGHLGVQLSSGGASEDFAPPVAGTFVADGAWHHVAITVQRTLPGFERVMLFVDGSPKAIDHSPLMGSLDNDWELYVGQSGGALSVFTGELDELALYDRALSSAEVVKQFKAGCAGKHAWIDEPYGYCAAGMSSGGCIPSIDWVGEPRFGAQQGFELLASGVDEGALGVLLYSLEGPGFTPWTGGALCIAKGSARRTPPVVAKGQGPCGGELRMDFNAWMAADPEIGVGTGVWAQWWTRGPAATGQPGGLQRIPSVNTDALHFRVK